MNPYEVLGVSEAATDKEIRAAYLELVKKYHPDRYTDSPLHDLADEKMKEINEAYDTITKMRKEGSYSSGSSGSYSGGSSRSYSGGFSGSYSGAYANEYNRIRELLNQNKLQEALAMLNAMSNRTAEWYYLYGITQFRRGDYMSARQSLETACRMDPNNSEYRQSYDVLMRRGSRSYHSSSAGSNTSSSDSCDTACNICSTLWCADTCCECMGGDLCRCC